MQPQTGIFSRCRANKCGVYGGGSGGRSAGVRQGRRLGRAWEDDAVDRCAIGRGLPGGDRQSYRRIVVERLDNCEDRRASLFCVDRSVIVLIVVGRMVVAMFADMEVEVEETGAERAVPMPIASGVQAETADADDNRQAQDRASQPETSDHGSTKASHLGILLDRAGQFLQRDRIRRHDGQIVTLFVLVAARIEDD